MATRFKTTLCAIVLVGLLLASGLPALAQESDPPCRYAPKIYYNIERSCLEEVYAYNQPPEAVPLLMGLAFAPDNTLYMARTAFGEIWAMHDADGDQYMDEPYKVAEDLELPIALVVHDESLFVLTAESVIRLDDADEDGTFERHTLLVDHLSDRQGWWPGGIGIGPDGRLYVTTGSCISCQEADPRRGALLSFALDGSDERLEATGLEHPTDFAWRPETGDLWLVDSHLPIDVSGADIVPDELHLFAAGSDYRSQPSFMNFGPGSNPSGLVFYESDAYPVYEGTLLVTLRGSWGLAEPNGYAILAIGFEANGLTISDVIAPTTHPPYSPLPIQEYSLSGQGIFPEHPADIVVSAEGWIYVSLEEGRILRFRPKQTSP